MFLHVHAMDELTLDVILTKNANYCNTSLSQPGESFSIFGASAIKALDSSGSADCMVM